MKKLIAVAAALLCSTSVYAADLRVAPGINKAPMVEVYDYFNGIYAGGYAGVGWDRGAGSAGDPLGSVGCNGAPFGCIRGLVRGVTPRPSRSLMACVVC